MISTGGTDNIISANLTPMNTMKKETTRKEDNTLTHNVFKCLRVCMI